MWERYRALSRRTRFGLPAAALVVLSIIVALTARPDGPGQTPPGASAATGAGGGGAVAKSAGSPGASPSAAVALNATPTRPPFAVGDVTPIPNRGITPTPTPSAARPGQALRLGDYTVTLLEVVDPVTSVYSLVQPTQGNRFLAAHVQVTNNSNRIVPYSYLHFRLRDVGGNELRSTASTTVEPAFQTGNLAQGETVSGWITFMARQGVDVDMLYFQAPGMIGPRGQLALR